MPALLAELIAARPDVIAAVGGNPVGIDAKKATSTIPVVFSAGADPTQIGLVTNLSRPEAKSNANPDRVRHAIHPDHIRQNHHHAEARVWSRVGQTTHRGRETISAKAPPARHRGKTRDARAAEGPGNGSSGDRPRRP